MPISKKNKKSNTTQPPHSALCSSTCCDKFKPSKGQIVIFSPPVTSDGLDSLIFFKCLCHITFDNMSICSYSFYNSVGQLKHLYSLDISQCGFEFISPEPFKHQRKLPLSLRTLCVYLNFWNASIFLQRFLNSHGKLEKFQTNQVALLTPFQRNYISLKELKLELGSKLITSRVSKIIENCPSLTSLDLQCLHITPNMFSLITSLGQLRSLNLTSTKCSYNSTFELKNSNTITDVCLNADIHQRLLASFILHLPNLVVLKIPYKYVTTPREFLAIIVGKSIDSIIFTKCPSTGISHEDVKNFNFIRNITLDFSPTKIKNIELFDTAIDGYKREIDKYGIHFTDPSRS